MGHSFEYQKLTAFQYDAGSIFAMITYVLTLSNSLEQVPTMIEEGVYFNDVSSRVSQNITD